MVIARMGLLVFVALLLHAEPVSSQAILLYDNGDSDYVGGFEMTRFTVADDFEVYVSAEASRGAFAMADLTCTFPANWDGHLRWWIFEDDGGIPGSTIATGYAPEVSVSLVWDNCPSAAHYSVQFKLGQMVSLSSGVRYWLALRMALDWSSNDGLYWSSTQQGGFSPGVSSQWGTDPWSTVGLEHSFRISLVGTDDYIFVDGFESGDTTVWMFTEP